MLERIPCEHAVCLDKENTTKLTLWSLEIDRWAKTVYELCREKDNDDARLPD